MRERLPLLVLSLALLIGSGWLLSRLQDDDAAAPRPERHDPDYYMKDFTRTGMDSSGQPKTRLSADWMAHFPDDDTIELEQPRLQVYRDTGKPIHVIAERGWVTSGNEVILLYGEVRIWRDSEQNQRQLEIITSDLKVLPDEDYAETDNAVTILTPTTVTDAIGMRMRIEEQQLDLLSEVKTRYEIAPTL